MPAGDRFNVGRNLALVADRWPDRIALVTADGDHTYRALDAAVNAAARGLAARGVGPGDRVGLLLPNSTAFVVGHFAVQKLGAVSVPVNYRLAADEVAYILDDAEVGQFLYDVAFAEAGERSADAAGVDPLVVGDGAFEALLDHDDAPVPTPAGRHDESFVAYTSGSTGRPKGVPHTHDDVILGATQVVQEMGLDRHDRALHIAPLFHVVGLNCFFNPHLFEGATNVLQREFDPEAALGLIERHEVTGTLGVPAQIRALLRVDDVDSYDLSSLQYVRTGGDPISERTIEAARSTFDVEFYNSYGLTETQQNATIYTPDDPRDRQTSVGKASYFWEVRVVETAAPAEVDPGDVVDRPGRGVVLIAGPMLTEGYLGRPDATAEAVIDVDDGAAGPARWLYTGDIADIDADGYISIVDRVDNLIKTGGETVYPQEVEDVLGDHDAVVDCGVFGTPSADWGEAVTAAVVVEGDVAEADLDEYLRETDRLADFKRPRRYAFVDDIPRNPGSGSIRRGQLEDLLD
ncbi:MAG: class I adenylate-forming enzyme family protein [Halobacteriales archaeon]